MKRKTVRNRISSSYLFLMELLIALLLFSVASAASVSVFMQSHRMSAEAASLNVAADQSASMAELIRSCTSIREVLSCIEELYPEGKLATEDGTVDPEVLSLFEPYEVHAVIGLDAQGFGAPAASAAVIMTVDAEQTDALMEAEIRCYEASGNTEDPRGAQLLMLPVTHYARRDTYE